MVKRSESEIEERCCSCARHDLHLDHSSRSRASKRVVRASVVTDFLVPIHPKAGFPLPRASPHRSKVSLSELSLTAAHGTVHSSSAGTCRQGGESYPIKAVLHNNLAGKGPDAGAEGIVFLVSEQSHGVDVRDLKISMHALGPYHPVNPEWNGLDGEFVSVNQFGGQILRVRIRILDVADATVRLDLFPVLLCDLEANSRNSVREYARAYGTHWAYWSGDTEIGLEAQDGVTEYWQRDFSAASG